MDFTNKCICRTCLSESDLKSIFEVDRKSLVISDMLMECTSVKIIKDDNMPSKMCKKCINLLKQSYAFKKQCENADATLRSQADGHGQATNNSADVSMVKADSQYYFCKTESETPEIPLVKLEIGDNELLYDTDDYVRHSSTPTPNVNGVFKSESENAAASDAKSESCRKGTSVNAWSDDKDSRAPSPDSDVTLSVKKSVSIKKRTGKRVKSAKNQTAKQSHVCHLCSKEFHRAWLLEYHLRVHSGESPFSCNFCGKSYRVDYKLQAHIRQEHMQSENNADETYDCPECSKVYPTKRSLYEHMLRHREKTFLCSDCGKDFITKKELVNHTNNVHTDTKPFKCKTCGKAFPRMCRLVQHNRKDCSFKVFMQKHLQTDMAKSNTCPICNKTYISQKGLIEHLPRHGEKKCLCEECGKKFFSKKELIKHITVHTGEKAYKCPKCDKAFARSSSLHIHNSYVHTEKKRLKCEFCDRAFAQRHNLADHMRTHTGEKPYTCEICNKSFPYNKSLIVHKRTHTGEVPYTCPFCGCGFNNLNSMKKHQEMHAVKPE